MKKVQFLQIILNIFFLTSCSEYQKVLKSSNLQYKYEKAIEYYQDKEYMKAYPLFEELIALYRGTEKAEMLYYYYAYTDYYLGDYLLASYRFTNFCRTFSNSKLVPECRFMSAYCKYKDSPKWSLDQTNTYQAIEELEMFANRYPTDPLVDSCTSLLTELRQKLELKAFETIKLYFKTENYKSVITTSENLLIEFPDTKFRDEALLMTIKSHYALAKNSVESKKLERYDNTIKAYIKFANQIKKKNLLFEAESIYDKALKEKSELLNS